MEISVKNLGALAWAKFELGNLTIICGNNNTGKTYATYALFGFLAFWREIFRIPVSQASMDQLLRDGVTRIDIRTVVDDADRIIKQGCEAFKEQLPKVFASAEKHFEATEFLVTLDKTDIHPTAAFERTIGAAKTQLFTVSKKENDPTVLISLIVEKEKLKVPSEIINRAISNALKDIVFGHLFPFPFIASAERTGAAIFRKELNLSRNRILDQMSKMDKDADPLDLLLKVYEDYALPVRANVEFTRKLEDISKKESFISKVHPELLDDFTNIIGGMYRVTRNDELYYVPKRSNVKLTMDESSSAVRSLLDIGFYLRHVAKPGDLLMVDEPELNLHPENQRLMARLFARLVNLGIRIFVTTHSDYIIKELNTLIMLNRDEPRIREIAKREGYRTEELLSPQQIKVYMAEKTLVQLGEGRRKSRLTFVAAKIDPEVGIEARSFDKTIEDMNRIQEEIVWGGEV
ncbi:MAG: hypothetical protein A4E61_01378 [Syntrophorhabdus sp. PtaB.Bin184]|jgi:AAA15 family ATPase/GTPase|nr:MAG: hypothetical protein A4E61_01378 [Syntrophorhabdus sp. PtaB.Bin184]